MWWAETGSEREEGGTGRWGFRVVDVNGIFVVGVGWGWGKCVCLTLDPLSLGDLLRLTRLGRVKGEESEVLLITFNLKCGEEGSSISRDPYL